VDAIRHDARADHRDANFGAGGECGHGNLLESDQRSAISVQLSAFSFDGA
jgi:hypothetical protein